MPTETCQLNVMNSFFTGLNDKGGILLCGYEWGGDPKQEGPDHEHLSRVCHTFSNKALAYGEEALKWPYDRNIVKWFGLWGHPLSRDGLGGDFEKSIVQTNWCDTQAVHMNGVDIQEKLLDPSKVEKFLFHVKTLDPKIIFFFGIKQLKCLQSSEVLAKFKSIEGNCTNELKFSIKPYPGRRFRVGFQNFEKCQVIGLPHPSGSRGLEDSYIALFKEEIGSILSAFKSSRSEMEKP